MQNVILLTANTKFGIKNIYSLSDYYLFFKVEGRRMLDHYLIAIPFFIFLYL